jgi:hypothetical protein
LALKHREYGRLIDQAFGRATFSDAPDESFINFDVTGQWATVTGIGRRHELPQLVANPPSALVCDASLSLDFLGRDTMPSAGHEVHRKEPDGQFGAALVKDGPGRRGRCDGRTLGRRRPAVCPLDGISFAYRKRDSAFRRYRIGFA